MQSRSCAGDTQYPAIIDHDSPRLAIAIDQDIPKAPGIGPIGVLDVLSTTPSTCPGANVSSPTSPCEAPVLQPSIRSKPRPRALAGRVYRSVFTIIAFLTNPAQVGLAKRAVMIALKASVCRLSLLILFAD